MLDHTPKAHSFEHDQPLHQQKAALPKTKGTLTNGTLLLLKSLAAFCMLGNVTASDGTPWSPAPPKITNQQHIQLDQAMPVGGGPPVRVGVRVRVRIRVCRALLAWPCLLF